ncbi:MAG: SdpI family protein [Firmicutes bacterium]|nr:SdpI family protein [Bacillota bacterium]
MGEYGEYSIRAELKRDSILMVLLLAALVGAAAVYPFLPARVPIHWNAAGEIDNYGSRAFGAFFGPLLGLGMYLLMLAVPLIDPRKANYATFVSTYRLFRWVITLFMLMIWVVTMFVSLGYPVDVGIVVRLGVGALFVFIGNHLGNVRHNYFVGIRTPWTLADPEVWRRTHRVGGWVMVAGGLLVMASALLPGEKAWIVLLVVAVGLSLGLTLYSCVLYLRRPK